MDDEEQVSDYPEKWVEEQPEGYDDDEAGLDGVARELGLDDGVEDERDDAA